MTVNRGLTDACEPENLTLTLLMLRVSTNNHDSAATTDDATLLTNFSDRCSNFHACFGNTTNVALYHIVRLIKSKSAH